MQPGAFLLIASESGQSWMDAAAAVSEKNGVPVRAVRIGHAAGDFRDHRLAWLRRREVGNDGAVLVRPDGVVAWRSDTLPADPTSALSAAIAGVLSAPSA
jgi:hypothetical protein